MLLTLGICDDSPQQVELLLQYVNGYRGEDQIAVVHSTDPEDFLMKMGETRPHLAFLDVDMGEMNGIQLGERLKALHEDTIIVYVTAHEQYALDAFRVRAFHYLIKPLTKDKFDLVLEDAVKYIRKNSSKPGQSFAVQKKGELIRFEYGDICCFEKVGHKIRIRALSGCVEYYGNFTRLLEEIDSSSFIQCHQGYIANIEKIRGFRDKMLFLDGGLQIPVSRSFVEGVKDRLARRLFAGRDGQ